MSGGSVVIKKPQFVLILTLLMLSLATFACEGDDGASPVVSSSPTRSARATRTQAAGSWAPPGGNTSPTQPGASPGPGGATATPVGGTPPFGATPGPGATPVPGAPSVIAIDMDISDNTATSLGSTENCISVPSSGSVSIDLIVRDVPPDMIVGFTANLRYDPARLRVTALDDKLFLNSRAGSSIYSASDATPDSDGEFAVAFLDTSDSYESGSGAMARITLQSLGSGVTTLMLADAATIDRDNQPHIADVPATRLALGASC